MAEFLGRHPTIQEVANIPPQRWLTAPGIGQTLLMELEAIIQMHQGWMTSYSPSDPADTELVEQLERLQRDLERLRRELRSVIDTIRRKRPDPGSSDEHSPPRGEDESESL